MNAWLDGIVACHFGTRALGHRVATCGDVLQMDSVFAPLATTPTFANVVRHVRRAERIWGNSPDAQASSIPLFACC